MAKQWRQAWDGLGRWVGQMRTRFLPGTVGKRMRLGAIALTLTLAILGLFTAKQLLAFNQPIPLPVMADRLGAALIPVPWTVMDAPLDLQVPPEAIAQTAPNYQPRQQVVPAHPSNYGDRFAFDVTGQPTSNALIIVLHETVGSAQSALNLFSRNHRNDADQVSYHTLIGLDGTIYYLVPPERRAFGAGNSVFDGPNGPETVRTHPVLPPSVNNFAYHISLETPSDGRGNRRTHSGYTTAQYESLAWLVARTRIPEGRITTHQAVDRSGSRMDPRSFNFNRFYTLLRRYPSRADITANSPAPTMPPTWLSRRIPGEDD